MGPDIDPAMRKAILAIKACGGLTIADIGRITGPITPRNHGEAMEFGRAMRSRLLQALYIEPSAFGNSNHLYVLTKLGRDVAYSLMEVE